MMNVCNFAHDTTFNGCGSDLKSIIQTLEHDSMLAIE